MTYLSTGAYQYTDHLDHQGLGFSSVLEEAYYDDETQTLLVLFVDSGRWRLYYEVNKMVFDGLGAAYSVGRYYNQQIKFHYRSEDATATFTDFQKREDSRGWYTHDETVEKEVELPLNQYRVSVLVLGQPVEWPTEAVNDLKAVEQFVNFIEQSGWDYELQEVSRTFG